VLSKKYASPLRLELKPSLFLLFLLLGLHLAALVLVYVLPFNLLLSFFVYLVIICSAYFSIGKYALRKTSSAIVRMIWDANNQWILERKDGVLIDAELMRDSYIHSFMSILVFKPCFEEVQEKPKSHLILNQFNLVNTYNVILLKDNVNSNDFRRLRVRLKVDKPIEADTL